MAYKIASLTVYCPQCDQVVQIIQSEYHTGPSEDTTWSGTCMNCGRPSVLHISQKAAEAHSGSTGQAAMQCIQCGSEEIAEISCSGCEGTGSNVEGFQCEICDGGQNHQGYQCNSCEATWGESNS